MLIPTWLLDCWNKVKGEPPPGAQIALRAKVVQLLPAGVTGVWMAVRSKCTVPSGPVTVSKSVKGSATPRGRSLMVSPSVPGVKTAGSEPETVSPTTVLAEQGLGVPQLMQALLTPTSVPCRLLIFKTAPPPKG